MDIKEMKYVQEVAFQKSFSKAADNLYISQSALSQKISSIEEQLGTKLFTRTTRSVSLTPAGEAFVSYSYRLLNLYDEFEAAMQEFSSSAVSSVSIGLFSQVEYTPFPGVITAFITENAQYHVDISVSSESRLITGLKDGNLDYALIRCYDRDIPDGISGIPLFDDEVCVLLHADDPLASRPEIFLRDLAGYILVCEKDGPSFSYDSFLRSTVHKGFSLSPQKIYSDSSSMLPSLLASPGRYAFTTRESGAKIMEHIPYLKSVKLVDTLTVTCFVLYRKGNRKGKDHALCKYLRSVCSRPPYRL